MLSSTDDHFNFPSTPPPIPPISTNLSESGCLPVVGQPSQPDGFLNSSELALLSHYLTHTSHVFSYDEDDSYVLQIGIPNLAFGSKPLMSSLLALAAIDKCNEVTKCKSLSAADLRLVRNLLLLGDWHHHNALRLIQSFLPDSNHYDHVLANAPLMVLYGTASHCIRVRMARRYNKKAQPVPTALQPLQGQWVPLIRAAYTAFMGVVTYVDQCFPNDSEHDDTEPQNADSRRPGGLIAGICRACRPEDGPTQRTRSWLYPVIARTHLQALEQLQDYADNLAYEQMHRARTSGINTCLETLDIMGDIFATVFSTRNLPMEYHEDDFLRAGNIQPELSSLVSPWLQKYVARVTYVTPNKPLRRVIMSFVNRVPLNFLSLVESGLEAIDVDLSPKTDEMVKQHDRDQDKTKFSRVHALALDIFAHWLVLVMLLDGVWWIGNIGDWELERIVVAVRDHGIALPTSDGTGWWPEDMYNTKRELAG